MKTDFDDLLNEGVIIDNIQKYIKNFLIKYSHILETKIPILFNFIKDLDINFKYKKQFFY